MIASSSSTPTSKSFAARTDDATTMLRFALLPASHNRPAPHSAAAGQPRRAENNCSS
jgi:hypothetical protein